MFTRINQHARVLTPLILLAMFTLLIPPAHAMHTARAAGDSVHLLSGDTAVLGVIASNQLFTLHASIDCDDPGFIIESYERVFARGQSVDMQVLADYDSHMIQVSATNACPTNATLTYDLYQIDPTLIPTYMLVLLPVATFIICVVISAALFVVYILAEIIAGKHAADCLLSTFIAVKKAIAEQIRSRLNAGADDVRQPPLNEYIDADGTEHGRLLQSSVTREALAAR